MAIKPLFDCLLCCDESLVMKKISRDALQKYTGFQFKACLPSYTPVAKLVIAPPVRSEVRPVPRVSHWSYYQRRKLLEDSGYDVSMERSLLRRERAQQKISFEDEVHSIYNPEYSDEDSLPVTGLLEVDRDIKPFAKLKRPRKKKAGKGKTLIKAFMNSLK